MTGSGRRQSRRARGPPWLVRVRQASVYLDSRSVDQVKKNRVARLPTCASVPPFGHDCPTCHFLVDFARREQILSGMRWLPFLLLAAACSGAWLDDDHVDAASSPDAGELVCA